MPQSIGETLGSVLAGPVGGAIGSGIDAIGGLFKRKPKVLSSTFQVYMHQAMVLEQQKKGNEAEAKRIHDKYFYPTPYSSDFPAKVKSKTGENLIDITFTNVKDSKSKGILPPVLVRENVESADDSKPQSGITTKQIAIFGGASVFSWLAFKALS